MAMVSCRECTHEISDQAVACPHCGCPLQEPPAQIERARNKKTLIIIIGTVGFAIGMIFIAIAVRMFVQQQREKNAKREAEVKYVQNIKDFNETMLRSWTIADILCKSTIDLWQKLNAINFGYGFSAEAGNSSTLMLFYLNNTDTRREVENLRNEVNIYYTALLEPPDDYEHYLSAIEKVYNTYTEYVDFAISTLSGYTHASYYAAHGKYLSAFGDSFDAFNALLPQELLPWDDDSQPETE